MDDSKAWRRCLFSAVIGMVMGALAVWLWARIRVWGVMQEEEMQEAMCAVRAVQEGI